MADVSRLLRGLFILLKAFLQSPAKKFVVLIHYREDTEALGRLLAEGMLGLFLSAAHEYASVQFRTVEIDGDTDLRVALRGALDRGCTVVEIIHRDGKANILGCISGEQLREPRMRLRAPARTVADSNICTLFGNRNLCLSTAFLHTTVVTCAVNYRGAFLNLLGTQRNRATFWLTSRSMLHARTVMADSFTSPIERIFIATNGPESGGCQNPLRQGLSADLADGYMKSMLT